LCQPARVEVKPQITQDTGIERLLNLLPGSWRKMVSATTVLTVNSAKAWREPVG
jgi:hypothetical protein